MTTLPQPFEVAREWTWEHYQPHYDKLEAVDLTTDNVDGWLADWTALYSTFSETFTWFSITSNLDANDKDAEKALNNFMSTVYPPLQTAQNKLQKKLLESGLTPDGLDITLKQMQMLAEIFAEVNLPLDVKENEIAREYGKVYGSQSVEWDGEDKTLVEMKKYNADADRDVREQAWRAVADRRLQDRETINGIWVQLMDIRKQQYENLDLENYREYAWRARQRTDYNPEDSIAFCEALEQVVVPVVAKIRENRRQWMGLETLRPWDTVIEPHDAEPELDQRPEVNLYDDGRQLITKSNAVFDQLDGELGGFFKTMDDNQWLSLENSKGKRPGAYCASLPVSKGAFIFGNATKQISDIGTVLHEAGHAFHAFYTSNEPRIGVRSYPFEFAEVASMSMELLALPYLLDEKGGFFSEEALAYYLIDQLEGALQSWSYQAVVVLFQHWAYTNHDLASDPAECDKAWTDIWMRFSPGVDYSGLEDWVATGWHRKQHIFSYPFYYIEYALAQLGAIQVWANSLENATDALEAYRGGLKLGNRVSLPELFGSVGAKLAFDADTLQQAVDLMNEQIDAWKAKLS